MKTPTIHVKRKQRVNYANPNSQWAQSSLQAWLGSGVRDVSNPTPKGGGLFEK